MGLCQAPAGVRRSGKRTVDGRTRKDSRSPCGDVTVSRDVLPDAEGAGRTSWGRPGEGSEDRRSPRRHAADGLFTPRAGLRGSRAAGGRAAPGGLEPEDPAVEGCDTEGAGRVAPRGAGSEPGHGARAPTTRAGPAPGTVVPMSS
ncbi:hypothetical protein Sgleb_74500 [Streptomyces glebosus]|uniref:Uncharacterized protein n=1 Tax=Streptomyces glebosus TaxID=249580 RepID=A0A640T6P9_9ACTN|nr:hypothetical protein Sgleb_74500 [Streptomyces glebosus]GHG62743.1 hypothetical protein GCM10010513_29710 [Streptomyces glebosus]